MNVDDFKINTINKINQLLDGWFDNGLQDGIINGSVGVVVGFHQKETFSSRNGLFYYYFRKKQNFKK